LRFAVRVQPRSSRTGVEPEGEGRFRVRVHSAPEGGKANSEVIELLAEHFGVPRTRIKILRGASSRNKIVEIDDYREQHK
jgi:uncharacterized protein (TIGR00251 family)